MMHLFSIEQLANVDDGSVANAFDKEVAKLANDIYDRPAMKAKRKITVEIEFSKAFPKDPESMDQLTEFRISSSLPKRSTSVVMLRSERGLEFNDKAIGDEDPRQMHLDADDADDRDD